MRHLLRRHLYVPVRDGVMCMRCLNYGPPGTVPNADLPQLERLVRRNSRLVIFNEWFTLAWAASISVLFSALLGGVWLSSSRYWWFTAGVYGLILISYIFSAPPIMRRAFERTHENIRLVGPMSWPLGPDRMVMADPDDN